MVPYPPQIDRNGSVFGTDGLARWNGALTKFDEPEWVVYYPGDTAALPTIAKGIITMLPRVGHINPHTLSWNDLRSVDIVQGNATLNRQKVSIECRRYKCQPNDYYGVTATRRNLGKVSYALRQYINYEPADATLDPTCFTDCLQRAQWVADQFNNDPSPIATAVVVSTGSGATAEHKVEIETLIAGAIIDYGTQGFTPADQLVPATSQTFMARHFREWFGSEFFPASVLDTKVFTVAQVRGIEYKKHDNFQTSSNASGQGFLVGRPYYGAVVFDPADTESQAALTELQAIANFEKTPSLYFSKLMSVASNPVALYPFTIVRTDAGSAGAYTTAQTAYAGANVVSFDRAAYLDGKSYYVLRSKANSQPAASGSDVVNTGTYGSDDTPCLDCV